MQLSEFREPFAFDGTGDGARIGVLVLHGFTGVPYAMRPLADAYAARGFAVRLPLLPGHGTNWRDLARTPFRAWQAATRSAYDQLAARCDHVFVCGLSMGGCLALDLAADTPTVAGVVLVNPAIALSDPLLPLLPALQWVKASIPAIGDDIKKPGQTEHAYERTPLRATRSMTKLFRRTVAKLDLVTAPLLVFRSRVDHVVPARSSALILDRTASADTEEVVLQNSLHVATLDNDAPLIIDRSLAFIDRLSR
ncbi:alpha/beta hydrolase [Spelaeicoccus albus]|uniref:Carboxylesterase n=1 Tax=Spelaeicoccus albus TaxID=1280376 RepID=A0A7Z0D3U0_9MICO|nr:alpha/beta fold hydrolase [Spelaeicoccus albus]NYI68357.1 carboxylesterase [Spelaeicoccus albus]